MKRAAESLSMGHPLYILLYGAGILFFCYFYTSIVFNPTDTADNMRKYGGFIPGIRPGKKTADYIDRSSRGYDRRRAVPDFRRAASRLSDSGIKVRESRASGRGSTPPRFRPRAGFLLLRHVALIVVGVAMDTVQQVESKLVEHHYTGFLKKSRIRGRRS
jgi:preprotein translocase subunit SecY